MSYQVRIKFKGISAGKYDYDFDLNDDFFSRFKESEIQKGNVHTFVEMTVTKDLLIFHFTLTGKVNVQCDRCLDFFYHEIQYKTTLYVEFGEKSSDISDADNRIMLSRNEYEIILDKHLYDYIHLSLPYQRIHPLNGRGESQCNIEMINKINELNNTEGNEIDPRWDKLKELFN